MKKYLIILISILFLGITSQTAFAEEKAAVTSAKVILASAGKEQTEDNRAKILKSFFDEHNSPLSDYADDFVKQADKYNLDWKLVAAISGVESTFGLAIPPNSYNGWGWGVYGDNVHYFNSWDDGIETVSQGLREQYMDKWGATNIYEIGSLYAASPAWASHVDNYMNIIQDYSLRDEKNILSLSL